MQCSELMCHKMSIMTQGTHSVDNMPKKTEKECIHSGHFMVSDFNAEAQDDEYEVAVPVPVHPGTESTFTLNRKNQEESSQQLSIETSLTKLFQCMSLAYRQKLTSPKWNRFKGIRLRWKDKIRLNNVIWRCWHMQFIMRQNTLVCQFASPLDVDTHNKPEAVVLEGKYWKRKLAAVTAEYKKWRMFYRNRKMGWTVKDGTDVLADMDMFDWEPHSNESAMGSMMVDEDYMEFMSDTLFSTITANQPFAFPDSREIARGVSIADFIQPSLVQLQPNLDDFMDTLEPLQDLLCSKLPSVPEESVADSMFRTCGTNNFQDISLLSTNTSNAASVQQSAMSDQHRQQELEYTATIFAQTEPVGRFQSSSMLPKSEEYGQGQGTPYQEAGAAPSLMPTRMGSKNLQSHNSQRANRLLQQQQVQQQQQQQQQQMQQQTSPMYQQTQQVPLQQSPFASFPLSDIQPRTLRPQPQFNPQTSSSSQGYKFTAPSYRYSPTPNHGYKDFRLPSPPLIDTSLNTSKPAHRSNSLPGPEDEMFAIPSKYNKLTKRNRSRSGPLHVPSTTQRQHPPPLVSANSDPSLPTLNSLQPLLAQLLTNNSPVYKFGAAENKVGASGSGKGSSVVPILPMPARNQMSQTTTLLITTPCTMSQQSNMATSQLFHNSISPTMKAPNSPDSVAMLSPNSMSMSPLSSPLNMDSPSSPSKSGSSKNGLDGSSKASGVRRLDPPIVQENWRHIMAEQKRRCNIKNGFDMLHKLIPQLNQNPNAKLSKAAMLQKGAEYIRQLQAERLQLRDEMDNLRQQIECLNTSISNCQSMLPATGAPVSRQRTNKMKEMFDEYVRRRTLENWKYWIFSILFEPLLVSFNTSVSTASMDDLCRSTLLWTKQHCSLVDLRPVVLNSLRYLCTSTDILSDPSKLPEEARKAVTKDRRTQ